MDLDFVPILIAILYQPFAGYTLFAGHGDAIDLYYYGSLASGSPIELQCMSTTKAYITAQTAYVESQNINSDFPIAPVRKAQFNSILQNVPSGCQVTTTTNSSYYLGFCIKVQVVNYKHSLKFRIVNNGQVLNMWSPEEELRFIADSANNGNMRATSISVDQASPDFREFLSYGSQSLKTRLHGGQIGANGLPCYDSIEETLTTSGSVSFSYNGFLENINFFDVNNYNFHVEPDYLFDKLGIPLSYTFPTTEGVVLIDYENPDKWGVDGKYWRLFYKWGVKVIMH